MTTAAKRKRLQEYIGYADDRKIQAIYTMVESEIIETQNLWSDPEFLAELDRRMDDFEKSDFQGRSWEEIKATTGNL